MYQHQEEEIQRLETLIERFKHKPKKAAFARSRKKLLERMERVDPPVEDDAHLFTGDITPKIPGSKWVLEAEHLQIGYETALLELSLRIRRGQKIGIIGSNGAGKSTFLKTAAGLLPPLKGTCTMGLHIIAGYFDQQTASLQSDKTVAEHFFLFPGKEASKKVSKLSGGEKSRLVLAELLQSRPNFLLLDEPTNHMDLPAKETLESALKAYRGTLLFVSHDRYFIRQTADALLIFDEASVHYYPFGYEHYLEHCRKTSGQETLSAQIRAEDQALLSSIQNVPKPERHRLREISSEHAYEDWQLHLALTPLLEAGQTLERFYQNTDPVQLWEDPAYEASYLEQEEILLQAFTQACLNWYDIWEEFQPAEA